MILLNCVRVKKMCAAYKTFPVLLQFAAKIYSLKNSGVQVQSTCQLMVYIPVLLCRNFTHFRLHEGHFWLSTYEKMKILLSK